MAICLIFTKICELNLEKCERQICESPPNYKYIETIHLLEILFTLQLITMCQASQIKSVSSRSLAVSNQQTYQNLNMLAVNQLVICGIRSRYEKDTPLVVLANRMLVAFSKTEHSKVIYIHFM